MQIQEPFGDRPLSSLRFLGLGIYTLVPDFRCRCPLCGGAGCAVRHGLYYRQVVDLDGSRVERFPIPRFRCRRRGQGRCEGVTFSVIPPEIVPRRRLSLHLMLRILSLLDLGLPVSQALDRLAVLDGESGEALLLEEIMIYRVLALFARAYQRLRSLSAPELAARPTPETPRNGALALAGMLGAPGAPLLVVELHHRYFPRLLLKA